jgi:Zn-dependent protease
MLIRGAIRLFRLWGIDVFLHWSWLLLVLYELQSRRGTYQSQIWNLVELIAVFAIVLVHEFGHATACRSVGGIAKQILLWPFGGIAFVQPPMRPGAYLWTAVAGPLVNVVLIPVTYGLAFAAHSIGQVPADVVIFFDELIKINWILLIFNLLPIYPLDGGQILRNLLWFLLGPIKSLRAAAIVGIVGIVGVVLLFTLAGGGGVFLYIIGFLGVMQCLAALQQARMLEQNPELLQVGQEPVRRPQVRCPACGKAAPIGPFWKCVCGEPIDIFATMGTCPRCGRQHYVTSCPDCNQPSPVAAWYPPGGGMPVVTVPPEFRPPFGPPPAFNSGENPRRDPQPPL